MYWTVVDSPIDSLLLIGDETGLRELQMEPHRPPAGAVHGDDALAGVAAQLTDYFAGRRMGFDLPLTPHGTQFQMRVWAALRDIPYGRTTTYGELATGLGQPTASRAVGLANGRNPLGVIGPAHGGIGATASLTGSGGVLDPNRWLREHRRWVRAGNTGK